MVICGVKLTESSNSYTTPVLKLPVMGDAICIL